MKKLFFALIFIPFLGLSQNDSIIKKSDLKHEVGTNIAPALVSLMNPNGHQSDANFTLMYKYHLTEKWGLRIIPSSTLFSNYWYFGMSYYENLLYEIENVEQVWERLIYESTSRPQINIGLERKKQLSKNTSLFYGIDLIYAYQHDFYELQEEVRPYDSITNEYTFRFDFTTISRDDFYTHFAGLSPFFGLKHNFGKRFVLSGNFNINFTKTFIKSSHKTYGLNPKEKVKYGNYHEVWSNGLISDLSISYKF